MSSIYIIDSVEVLSALNKSWIWNIWRILSIESTIVR